MNDLDPAHMTSTELLQPTEQSAELQPPKESKTTGIWLAAAIAGFVLVAAVGVGIGLMVSSGSEDGSEATVASVTTTVLVTSPEPIAAPPTRPAPPPTTAAPTTTMMALPPVIPLSGQEARVRLDDQIGADEYSVDALLGWWIPQVSTKREGLDVEDDGLGPYTLPLVLSDHLTYRARYEEIGIRALLIRSEDYNFEQGGFWVTILEKSFSTAEEANGFCSALDIPPTDCFARRIGRGPYDRGDIKYRQ